MSAGQARWYDDTKLLMQEQGASSKQHDKLKASCVAEQSCAPIATSSMLQASHE